MRFNCIPYRSPFLVTAILHLASTLANNTESATMRAVHVLFQQVVKLVTTLPVLELYLERLWHKVPRSGRSIHPEYFAFIDVRQQTFSQQVSGTVFRRTRKNDA